MISTITNLIGNSTKERSFLKNFLGLNLTLIGSFICKYNILHKLLNTKQSLFFFWPVPLKFKIVGHILSMIFPQDINSRFRLHNL